MCKLLYFIIKYNKTIKRKFANSKKSFAIFQLSLVFYLLYGMIQRLWWNLDSSLQRFCAIRLFYTEYGFFSKNLSLKRWKYWCHGQRSLCAWKLRHVCMFTTDRINIPRANTLDTRLLKPPVGAGERFPRMMSKLRVSWREEMHRRVKKKDSLSTVTSHNSLAIFVPRGN